MADKKSIVTLDIGSQRVSLARFSPAKGGGLVLQDYAFSELSGDPAADSARIPQVEVAVSELVSRIGVAKEDVRYSISGHSVFSRFVKLPALDEEKVDDIVRFEAQQNVPFPINEVAWDYQLVPTGGDDGEVEVVLVAIKSDAIEEINSAVEAGPLVARGVDIAPMAIYNAFRHNYPEAEGCSLIIDVGARSTDLLYVEGDRVFTRSIAVGGASASTNIAKEFEMAFADAEERKKQDGFVSLGGAYADHEDPGIAAMSKVIRNTMTRLHSEIVRTTSAYRQQGGGAPTMAYLCGGSAGLPYLREFLAEKLELEVEYFNALRNVGVGGKVDAEAAGADAHTLGEMVGLALRDAGKCPMEIDLIPETIERRRDIEKRKPFLITAAACLLGLLLATGLHFNRAKSLADRETAKIADSESELKGFDRKIQDQLDLETALKARGVPLQTAAMGRSIWLEIAGHLNNCLDGDKVWFTQIEPRISGSAMVGAASNSLSDQEASQSFQDDEKPADKPDPSIVTHIRLYGLFRDSSDRLYGFEEKLRKDPKFFKELPKVIGDVRTVHEPEQDVEYVGQFRYDLELANPIYIGAPDLAKK